MLLIRRPWPGGRCNSHVVSSRGTSSPPFHIFFQMGSKEEESALSRYRLIFCLRPDTGLFSLTVYARSQFDS